MPADDFLARARGKSVSLRTLEEISGRYEVSVEAAFLRLRQFGLWNCEMSVWHRMTSGEFVMSRGYGCLKADWRWLDDTIPMRAWGYEGAPLAGKTFVYFERSDRRSAAESVHYEVKRRGDGLLSLWSRNQLNGRGRKRHTEAQWTLYK